MSRYPIEIHGIFIAPAHQVSGKGLEDLSGEDLRSEQSAPLLANAGIEGDRFCRPRPDYNGHVTFCSLEAWQEVTKTLALPRWLGDRAQRAAASNSIMLKGEKFNSVSHLVGAILALAGLIVLVVRASLQGDPWKIVSFSVYGTTLVALYTASTLYHSTRGPLKALFMRFDHIAIYLLIAGTYTPFTLVTLRGPWGWSLFGAVWSLALLGILFETRLKNKKRVLPLLIYIAMGWLIAVAYQPIIEALPMRGVALLAAGGSIYTLGVVFYVFSDRIRHFHGIWHLFVLGGSICHFFAILLEVL